MRSLIDVVELVELRQHVVILDVRWRLQGPSGLADYEASHIPGAVFVDLDRDLAAEPGERGRHPLPHAADFEQAMRRCGVSNDVPVVCYDIADATSAARAWWLLRYFGHLDVRVLDGGYAAWIESGAPTSRRCRDASGRGLPASPGGMALVDADQALAVARDGVLLDARAAEGAVARSNRWIRSPATSRARSARPQAATWLTTTRCSRPSSCAAGSSRLGSAMTSRWRRTAAAE